MIRAESLQWNKLKRNKQYHVMVAMGAPQGKPRCSKPP